jgi:hypothetical protein
MQNTRRKHKSTSSLNKTTLDTQHNMRIQKIRENQTAAAQLADDLNDIELRLRGLENEPVTSETLSNILYLKDQKNDIKAQLKSHQLSQNETSYLVDTADILFKYYDLLENGADTESNSVPVNHNSSPASSILTYFVTSSSAASTSKPSLESTSADFQASASQHSRGTLLDMYLELVDRNHQKMSDNTSQEQETGVCNFCKSCNIILMTNDGYMYCKDCHTMEYMIVDHDKPSYKDPPKEPSYFAYKRVNHLNEWLAQIQGRESTDIPDEIFDKILLEVKKQKIVNMAKLTHSKVKEILKKLKINKYYEHIPYIINRINGMPMPHLTPDLEEKLRDMFRMIQTPFLKHSPANRKNFLSYSFCLRKFLELLEKDEYLNNFPLLKSREKLAQQDAIWKAICEDLGWQFIQSL